MKIEEFGLFEDFIYGVFLAGLNNEAVAAFYRDRAAHYLEENPASYAVKDLRSRRVDVLRGPVSGLEDYMTYVRYAKVPFLHEDPFPEVRIVGYGLERRGFQTISLHFLIDYADGEIRAEGASAPELAETVVSPAGDDIV